MDTDETAEDRRVMALANDLRISSAISPHDLMSLRTTTPLESDDGLDDEEEDDGQEGKEEEKEAEDPSGRAVTGFFPRSGNAVSRSLPQTPERGAATPAVSSGARRRNRRRRPRGNNNNNNNNNEDDDDDDSGAADSSSSNETGRNYHLRGVSIKSSMGISGASSSSATGDTGDNDDDNDSWMQSPGNGTGVSGAIGAPGSSHVAGGRASKNQASSLRFLSGGGVTGRHGRGSSSEDTASSSSATLSLQLPFSEDEAALLNVLGQTFRLPAADGGLAALQQRRGLLEGLVGGSGEAVRARMVGLREEELAQLERRRAALEGDLRQERARHESQIQSLEKRWLEQVAALKKGQEMAEMERDTLEARLRDKKDMYKDLALSDALSRELRRVPEEEQTIKEYVSLKAYDLVASSKGELERTRRELEKTQEQLLATTETGELQRREDARARRLATAREEGLKVDLEASKSRAEEMASRAREAHRAADENKDKARSFDEVEALLRTARLELDAARALSKSQAAALVDVAESEKAAGRAAQDAVQRSAMLEMDKTYLQRELSEVQSRADRLGRESEAASERLRDLERSKDAVAAELVSVRERTRSEHEDRLEAEVGRLREQSAKELADIRANGREAYERENETLREARKDALQECARVRSELSELQRSHEDLVMAMAKSEAAHETAIGEVRSELRLKSFELSQLGVAHSEKCSSLRQAVLEVDMLKEQVAVHRTEFAELEASTTRKISEQQLLLASERDKVRAFEDLELEVDDAVMRTGREMLLAEQKPHHDHDLHSHKNHQRQEKANEHNDEQGEQHRQHHLNNSQDRDDLSRTDNGAPSPPRPAPGVPYPGSGVPPQEASTGGGGTVLGSAVAGGGSARGGAAAAAAGAASGMFPMAPHRRLRQAVLLAQKLLRKEGELDVARTELADVRSRVATWENRALRAEGLLESVEQPTKYMIDSIRSKEAEIESLRSAQHRLVAKTEALERACRETAVEKDDLEKDLQQAARRLERARSNAGRKRGRSSRSPGSKALPREAGASESEAGGAPARAPQPASAGVTFSVVGGGDGGGRGVPLPSRLLSEKMTVHGGRGIAEGAPRWYSYRQSTTVRVPAA